MALLDTVKQALGIYYTEPTKDAEIQSIIDFAENYLLSAGVPSADLAEGSENPLAVQAIIIQAKMAINTDPTEMRINPFLVSIIEQLRMAPQAEESEESEDTPSDTEQTDDPIIIDPVLDGDDNENQG
jgi:hypothetical protein